MFECVTVMLGSFWRLFARAFDLFMFVVQGLFAIIEFDCEEAAQRALSHGKDILLRGRRLVVRPRRLKQQVAPASDDHDHDQSNCAEQSAADLHSQLTDKLTGCGSVCISLLHLLSKFFNTYNCD